MMSSVIYAEVTALSVNCVVMPEISGFQNSLLRISLIIQYLLKSVCIFYV